ncbi:MAG: hypothetical protein JNN11_00595 [Candidatus Doudnabacteria bacterium]|nr:hypothetical protein [Candidatus Doudnabacteria bacterium]
MGPALVFAADSQPTGLVPCGRYNPDGTVKSACTFLDIFVLFARLTNWLIGVSGLYAVYNIITHGFWLVLSQGNEEAIASRKKGITNAVVGMTLVFMAYMFINFVINGILVAGMKGYQLDLRNPLCYLSPTTQNQCFVQVQTLNGKK